MMPRTLEDEPALVPPGPPTPASGLASLAEIVEDPASLFGRAFDARRTALALFATALLVAGGSLLKLPAFAHASGIAAAGVSSPVAISWIGALLTVIQIISAACTVGLLFALTWICRIIFKWCGSIGQYWGAVCAIAVVGLGLAALADGLIVRLIPADRFTSMTQLAGAVPSLASLFPAAPHHVHALLMLVDPFKVWTCVLVALLFSALGKAPRSRALAAAVLVTFVPPALGALFT